MLSIIKRKMKKEKGSISTLVLFTVLMFTVILLGIYYSIIAKQKAQLEGSLRIQKIYGAYTQDADHFYSEQEIKMDKTPPSVTMSIATDSIVEAGLIRYYDGKNIGATTWKDLTGSYDGIINGATVNAANGYVAFDGTDDFVNLGQIVNKTAVTLEAEVSINAVQSGEKLILCNYEGGGTGLGLVDNKPYFQIYLEGVGWKSVKSTEEIEINRNYNLSGTYDGRTLKLYVDGKLMAGPLDTGGGKIANPANNTIMAMGANPAKASANAGYNKMKLYSARIYDRALSQDEINQNINVTININFSEAIKDLSINEITTTNASEWTIEKNGDSYIMKMGNVKNDTPLTISIPMGAYKDLAGNLGEGYTFSYKRTIKDNYTTAFERDYTKIDYIESTGTQYIDTNFKPTPETGFETIFQYTDLQGQQRICGTPGNATDTQTLVYDMYINGTAASGGKLAYAYRNGTGNWVSTGITADLNKHKLRFNVSSKNYILDSTSKAIDTSASATYTSQCNLFLMARSNWGTTGATQYGKLKIYSFDIYERGYMAKQLIPCKRNSDGKPGLYDRINHEFYTNKGTGEFVMGADSTTVYSATDLVFNGTNYIDTGIKLFNAANKDKDFEIKINISDIELEEAENETAINAMYEVSPYPGILLRARSGKKVQFVGNATDSLKGNSNINWDYSAFLNKTFVIQRINKIIYYGFEKEEKTAYLDMSSAAAIDTPLTIGGSLDGSGNPFRYFEGKISNISISLK